MQALAFLHDHLRSFDGHWGCFLYLGRLTLCVLLAILTPLFVNRFARHPLVRALLLLQNVLELVHVEARLRPVVGV
jgi:hypothetical protein